MVLFGLDHPGWCNPLLLQWKLVFLLLCVNVHDGSFCLFTCVISASHIAKLELYLSSVNRGADICDKYEPEFCM